MAAYRRVYDLCHQQADCQEPGSAPEPYARQSSMGYLYLFTIHQCVRAVPERWHSPTDLPSNSIFKSDVFDVLNVFILTFLYRGNYFYVMLFSDLLVVSVSVTKKIRNANFRQL